MGSEHEGHFLNEDEGEGFKPHARGETEDVEGHGRIGYSDAGEDADGEGFKPHARGEDDDGEGMRS